MNETVNEFGMTFREWVAAAGVAKFENDEIIGDTSTYPLHLVKAWELGDCPTDWFFDLRNSLPN